MSRRAIQQSRQIPPRPAPPVTLQTQCIVQHIMRGVNLEIQRADEHADTKQRGPSHKGILDVARPPRAREQMNHHHARKLRICGASLNNMHIVMGLVRGIESTPMVQVQRYKFPARAMATRCLQNTLVLRQLLRPFEEATTVIV